jgi:hypothetical protein
MKTKFNKFNENMKEEKKWVAYFGSVNKPIPQLLDDEMTQEQAEQEAYQLAIDDFETYEGLHGTRTTEDIMEEDEIDDYDEAYEIYNEERESWLNYWVEEYEPEKHDDELDW